MPEQEEDIFAQDNTVEVETFIPQDVISQQYIGSVEIGNVVTLPAGSDATVENVGDATHAVLNFGIPKGDAGSMWGELAGDLEDQSDLYTVLTALQNGVNAAATLNNPAFTGVPTAPTAQDNTNTTQIATTAFVQNAITLLNNSLRSYINNQVANMLKTMDFSGTVSFNLNPSSSSPNSSYTAPSDGYFFFTLISANHTGCLLLDGKDMYINSACALITNMLYPVKSGTVLNANYISGLGTQNWRGQANGIFIPFES